MTDRIRRCSAEDLCLNTIIVAELRYGADKSQRQQANHARIDVLLAEIQCQDFGVEAGRAFGRVRAALEGMGQVIGPYDMLIAAHALSQHLVLVTDNVRELSRVQGLEIENWR